MVGIISGKGAFDPTIRPVSPNVLKCYANSKALVQKLSGSINTYLLDAAEFVYRNGECNAQRGKFALNLGYAEMAMARSEMLEELRCERTGAYHPCLAAAMKETTKVFSLLKPVLPIVSQVLKCLEHIPGVDCQL